MCGKIQCIVSFIVSFITVGLIIFIFVYTINNNETIHEMIRLQKISVDEGHSKDKINVWFINILYPLSNIGKNITF